MNPILPFTRNGLSRRSFVAAVATTGGAMAMATRLAFSQAASSPVSALPDGEAAWPEYNLKTITADQVLSIPGAGEQMTRRLAGDQSGAASGGGGLPGWLDL